MDWEIFFREEIRGWHDSICKNGKPGSIIFCFMNFYSQRVTPPSDNPDGWNGDFTLERKGGMAWLFMQEKANPSLYYFLFYRFLFSEGGTPSDTPDASEAPENGVRNF